MKITPKLSFFVVVLILTLPGSTQAQPDQVRVFEQKVGAVPEFFFPLRAGQRVTFETRNLSSGIDPVLHLWDITHGVEIAIDDNSGGGKAALLRTRVNRIGNYALIVRPRNFLSPGVTDIFKDGKLFRRKVKVGGWFVFLLNLKPMEQINVLPPPNGASSHFLYLLADDGLHIESRRRGAPRSLWETPPGTFGFRTLLIGVRPQDADKPMRLYRNDTKLAGADPDGDGLGVGLERQLKTCSRSSDSFDAFPCDRDHVADLRDTDGDGISDGWEVLGRDFSPGVYVALPTWGSNPRHKDLFIEADYRRLTEAENMAQIKEKMPAKVALQFAFSYGDNATTLPLLRLLHAKRVANPDDKPGISVHIDSGRAPEKPDDASIYGDWGGYSVIDAVIKDGVFAGQDPGELWKTHMHPSRRGIFLYGPGHKSGGGQCGIGQFFCGYNFNDSSNATHEIMHALGFDHSGPSGISRLSANCKPNYPSLVNYSYQSAMLMSDGRDRPPLNNTALKESKAVPTFNTTYLDDLQNKYKFLVDRTNGHVDWNRDGVFAPADQRVRGYANYAPGQDCEFTRMNQVEFSGTEASSVAITRMGVHTLLFFLDKNGVVRMKDSKSNWKCPAAEKNCSGGSFADSIPVSFPVATVGMDAERVLINNVEQVVVIAIGADGKIRERRFTLTSNGNLSLAPQTLEFSSAPATGEPSLAETRDGNKIYLVYKGTDNVIRWRFRDGAFWEDENIATDSNGAKLTAAPEASPGIASGYLTPNGTAAVFLAYSDSQQRLLRMHFIRPSSRNWELASIQDQLIANTVGRPAMAWVPNTTGFDSPGQFYMVVRGQNDVYLMTRSYFNFAPGQNRILMGLLSSFDNVFLAGNAIDITASPSTGHPQLWAVLTFAKKDEDGRRVPLILFRPRADGISDVEMTNHDDWTVLGWGVCQTVANPEGTVSNPIRCKSRPF